MAKNILFYIPSINQKDGGVRQYSFNVLKMIAENNNENYHYYIYHKRKDELFLNIINQTKNFHLVPTFFVVKTAIKLCNVVLKPLGKKIEFIDYLIKKHQIDIIHCPYQFVPKTTKAKLISTMHDVQDLHYPEFFTQQELERRAVNYKDYIKRSDAIIVSYHHVKEDIVKFFHVSADKVFTFLIGINNLWIMDYFNQKSTARCETKFDTFLLYPANSWKHKNHIGLLEALRILKSKNRLVNLVLTGDFNNDYGQFLIGKINEYDLSDQIELKGIVTQNELYGCYTKARAVVVPTLYEAGSYPLYESICIEKAVVCSNVTSLPETIGDDQFVFNPNDYNDIADKMEKIYFDDAFHKASADNAVKMKKELLHNDSDKILYRLYETV